MNFDNWQTVAAVFFFIGMGAGLVCAVVIGQVFWKISAYYCSAQAAARIAEKSCQEAEICINERMLLEQRERMRKLFEAAEKAEEQELAVRP